MISILFFCCPTVPLFLSTSPLFLEQLAICIGATQHRPLDFMTPAKMREQRAPVGIRSVVTPIAYDAALINLIWCECQIAFLAFTAELLCFAHAWLYQHTQIPWDITRNLKLEFAQTNKHTNEQTHKQTNKQTNKQTSKQANKRTHDKQTKKSLGNYIAPLFTLFFYASTPRLNKPPLDVVLVFPKFTTKSTGLPGSGTEMPAP